MLTETDITLSAGMLAAFILLQILDATTTYKIIKKGGRELNPVLVWLAERVFTRSKWAWLIVAKAVVVAAGFYLYYYDQELPLVILTFAYVIIVVRNVRELRYM